MGTALVTALVSMLAIVFFFLGIYTVVERPDDMANRLSRYTHSSEARADEGHKRSAGLTSILNRLDRLLSGQGMAQRMALQLAQANIRTTVSEFVIIEASAGVVCGAVGYLMTGYYISLFAGAVAGIAVPYLIVQRKRSKRIKDFHEQLTDVLALIVGSLKGGHALPTALDMVSKELSPPACEEFTRVLREIGFGLSQTEALNNLVQRMDCEDLQLVVTAVNISHEVGGNLSLVLEKIAETIRERIRIQGEIRVLTTQQRLTSYILVALPFVLGIALSLINPGWMMQMFEPGWVRIIPATALVLELIGFLITQKLTRIEV